MQIQFNDLIENLPESDLRISLGGLLQISKEESQFITYQNVAASAEELTLDIMVLL